MIKPINDLNQLKEISGGAVVIVSSSNRSESFDSDSLFADFFARRDAARARNAEREAARAANPSTGRRGFSPSAAIGLGSNVGI